MARDFDLSGRFRLDGSDAVRGAREVEGSLEDLADAQRDVGRSGREAATGTGAAATATDKAGRSAKEAETATSEFAQAEARLAKEVDDARRAMAQAAGQVDVLQTRQRKLRDQTDEAAKASQRAAYGARNLGQQFGDLGAQIGGGTSVARAFAQQAGQIGYALSEMEGRAGKVGAFLTGPWGIALTVAASVLAPFVEKLLTGGDAADKAKASTIDFSSSLNSQIGVIGDYTNAVDQLDKATRGLLKTQALLIDNTRAFAQSSVSRLERQLATVRGQMGGNGTAAFDPLSLIIGRPDDPRQKALQTQAAQLERQLASARGSLARSQAALEARSATEAVDPKARQRGEIERARARLDERRAFTLENPNPVNQRAFAITAGIRTISADDYRREVAALKQREDAMNASAKTEARATGETRARRVETVSMTAATRDAARVQADLDRSLDTIVRRYDPLKASAADYLATLRQIADLKSAGRIGQGDALRYSIAASRERSAALGDRIGSNAETFEQVTDPFVEAMDEAIKPGMIEAGKAGGDAFREAGTKATEVITALFGSKVGGIAKLLNGVDIGPSDLFQQGLKEAVKPLKDVFENAFGKIGQEGTFTRALGRLAGGAGIGSTSASLFNKVTGSKGSSASASLGGAGGNALGNLIAGPAGGTIGSIIGGIGGSLIGSLFKSAKFATASITNGTVAAGRSNSSSRASAALGAANSVSEGVQAIVDALGGTLGDYNVSVGKYKDTFRVSGTGYTGKLGGSNSRNAREQITSYDTEAEAYNAAVANAIADGAIGGLSAAMQRAVQANSGNADKVVSEALKVKDIEKLIGGLGSTLKGLFSDFDATAKDRIATARKYGLDIAQVEKVNAEQRAKLVEDTLKSRIGSLSDFLSSIKFGDLFEGSATDRRTALLAQIDTVKGQAEAGADGAADQLQQLYQQLLSTSREAFGTAGTEYTSDRSGAVSEVERVIQMETRRVNEASAMQQATTSAVNENNALTAITNAKLDALPASIAAQLAAIGFGGGAAGLTRVSRL